MPSPARFGLYQQASNEESMLKYKNEKMVSVQDWDAFVIENYGRPYSFRQQDGCKPRGVHRIEVPSEVEDYPNDSVPEVINGEKMGVSFEAWKKRDPKAPVGDRKEDWEINMFWDRNFLSRHSGSCK